MSNVYCDECRHKRDMGSDSFPWTGCAASLVEKQDWRSRYVTYAECFEVNKNNDCQKFEPKVSIWKRMLAVLG